MWGKIARIAVAGMAAVLAVATFQFLDRGRPADVPPKDRVEVVAHRGVHTNWQKGAYDIATGCEAIHIYEPTHEHIENTLESIGAAFEMGATIVEIDIRRSSDSHLVVFHDYDLACRTNGTGEFGDHPLAYLKTLDIGYGYTADGGATYPFRGKGVGRMPALPEVLAAFPDRRFLIDHKDGSIETAELLVEVLRELPAQQQERISYWGPEETFTYIHAQLPAITRLFGTRQNVKSWVLGYLLALGLSGFPEESQGLVLAAPPEILVFLWGWPYRFLQRVSRAGAGFYLMVDTAEDARRYQGTPVDGIVTDYIEVVGPYFR
jgi:glycerophosphoryl diester phosphodiesterase